MKEPTRAVRRASSASARPGTPTLPVAREGISIVPSVARCVARSRAPTPRIGKLQPWARPGDVDVVGARIGWPGDRCRDRRRGESVGDRDRLLGAIRSAPRTTSLIPAARPRDVPGAKGRRCWRPCGDRGAPWNGRARGSGRSLPSSSADDGGATTRSTGRSRCRGGAPPEAGVTPGRGTRRPRWSERASEGRGSVERRPRARTRVSRGLSAIWGPPWRGSRSARAARPSFAPVRNSNQHRIDARIQSCGNVVVPRLVGPGLHPDPTNRLPL